MTEWILIMVLTSKLSFSSNDLLSRLTYEPKSVTIDHVTGFQSREDCEKALSMVKSIGLSGVCIEQKK